MARFSSSSSCGGLFAADGTRKYLTTAEIHAFLQAAALAAPHIQLLCQVLAFTGCRLSEALHLKANRIDVTAGALTFETLKQRRRGSYRQVPIPDELLMRLDGIRPSSGGRIWPVHRQTAWRWVQGAMEHAELSGVRANSRGLRHGFAIAAIQADIPLNLVQKWLGHARLTTTAIYANALGPEERALAQRLWS